MRMRLFVGNISHSATEENLKELFEESILGLEADSVVIIRDRATGHSRGFGFIQVATVGETQEEVIEAMNGTRHMGRTLTVNAALPEKPREEYVEIHEAREKRQATGATSNLHNFNNRRLR